MSQLGLGNRGADWIASGGINYDDVISEAAALWESLSQNHPFVDGNKRTAFAVTFTFLAINDYAITADEEALLRFLIPLYERSALDFDTLEKWLRVNTTTG